MRGSAGAQHLSWLVARPVAHRGLHDRASGVIENTASAVAAAIANGYGIEVDLQRTGDGEAIVFHDATLDRLTNGRGAVVAHTLQELKKLAITGSEDRIQTLGELLDQVAGRTTLVLELKSLWDGCGPLEKRVAQVLAGYVGPVAVMSFDPDSVAALAHYTPNTPRGFTCGRDGQVTDGEHLSVRRRRAVSTPAILDRLQPDFLAHHVRSLPSPLTRWARRHHRPVLTWTVRTASDRRQAALFADQMIFEGFRP
ncbi:glycerophosphodiester phosphodiesterase family protein [Rhodoligotrophos defluvii]|uniref:glycerophosphodiester phosphodiesterase family protein n=1 Tax=Rhodoligotrophos defluvii TaxID=2561934 RepID=UPI0010C9BDF1|nr:glycerophosphodiester phosphodiesterase family protein [Rhodoligotrophos defluvii]